VKKMLTFFHYIVVGVAWEWQSSFGVSLNSVQQAKAKTSKKFQKFRLLIRVVIILAKRS
jgi:hypothetical protein